MNSLFMKFYGLLLIVLTSASTSLGQSPDLSPFYQSTLKPGELNISSADRLDKLFKYYAAKNSEFKELEYEDFVYRSNYFLEKLNTSGQVFYGDPVSEYLNDLKDFLLEGHPSKKEIRVYVTRHPSLNAFTNDFGDIYVNIGAVSKVHNELELLALLAHEISHIHNKHSHKFEQFRRKVKGDQWKEDEETAVLSQHVFSREQEYAADLDGFKLLVKRGVDTKLAREIFTTLRYDLDPNLKGDYSTGHIACGETFAADYLVSVFGELSHVARQVEENTNDSLTTHPSTIKRFERIGQFLDSVGPAHSYQVSGRFDEVRDMANFVLVNTYIENDWYIECLDLIAKLRLQHPGDDFLIKSNAKVLLLLTQSKYRATPFLQFINSRGSAYRDSSFLEMKEAFMSLNSFEMNLFALLTVDQLRDDYNIEYLDRVHQFLIKFLYKFNPDIFTYSDNRLVLKSYDSLDSNSIRVNDLSLFLNLTRDQRKYYDDLVENHNFVNVEIRSIKQSESLVKHFLSNYELTAEDFEAIEEYKEQRNMYELMLTLDQVFISLHPYESLKNYRRGVYNKTADKLSLDSVALVQSSSFFLEGRWQQYEIDFKKSLLLEKQMVETLNLNEKIDQNYSNLALEDLSVKDINQHFALMLWLDERFLFDDLIYSRVDEQIENFKSESGIRYLLFNLNGSSVNKGSSPKHISYGYNVYFDLRSEGVTYISKIASKEKGNPMIFKQLFHLSNHNLD